MGRFEIVLGRLKIVVDRCGSLWIVVGSLWVVVDRCGSLWVVVDRCGSFRVLVTTVYKRGLFAALYSSRETDHELQETISLRIGPGRVATFLSGIDNTDKRTHN